MDSDVLIVGARPSSAIAAKRLGGEGLEGPGARQGGSARLLEGPGHRDHFPLTAGRDWAWDPRAPRAR